MVSPLTIHFVCFPFSCLSQSIPHPVDCCHLASTAATPNPHHHPTNSCTSYNQNPYIHSLPPVHATIPTCTKLHTQIHTQHTTSPTPTTTHHPLHSTTSTHTETHSTRHIILNTILHPTWYSPLSPYTSQCTATSSPLHPHYTQYRPYIYNNHIYPNYLTHTEKPLDNYLQHQTTPSL